MSDFIGVIRNVETKEVYAVINPGFDHELDNPRWWLLKRAEGPAEAIELIRVPRGDYMNAMTTDQLHELLERLKPKP
jgi:hypothetical protein